MDELEKINEQLSQSGHKFRVVNRVHSEIVGVCSEFVANIGPVIGGEVFIDSNLNRYFRTPQGDFFTCTNKDLTGMLPEDQKKFIQELTGLYN